MLIFNLFLFDSLQIGCKVTHFLSITQTFYKKTDVCVHTQGVNVQVFIRFFGNFYTLPNFLSQSFHQCGLFEVSKFVLIVSMSKS